MLGDLVSGPILGLWGLVQGLEQGILSGPIMSFEHPSFGTAWKDGPEFFQAGRRLSLVPNLGIYHAG